MSYSCKAVAGIVKVLVTVLVSASVCVGSIVIAKERDSVKFTLSSSDKSLLIDKLLELNGARYINEEMAVQYTQNLRRHLVKSGVELDSKFFDIVQREAGRVIFEYYVNSEEFDKVYHRLYDEAFSEQDLKQLIGFYESRLGQKLVATSGQLARQGHDKSVEFANTLLPQIQQALELSLADAGFNLKEIADSTGKSTKARRPSSLDMKALIREKCTVNQATVSPKIGLGGAVNENTESTSSGGAKPVFRGQPEYPYLARLLGMNGWVELSFTVNGHGRTSNITVSDAIPKGVFDRAAIASVEKYRYCTSDRNFSNQKIRIRFEMAE